MSMIPDLRRGLRAIKRRRRRKQPPARPDHRARAVPVRNSVVKRPAFFCEFCGTQVRQNDRVCSHCGRFFSSVKCPSCGFAGDSRIFRDGCPSCGYAVAMTPGASAFGSRKKSKGNVYSTGSTVGAKATPPATDPLPWWVYAITVFLLAALVSLILLWK